MSTATSALITLDEQGVARIGGTRTKVMQVVLAQQASGVTPEELGHELPHLTLAQIRAALAYYGEHREALDAEIQQRFERAEQLRAEAGESPFARRMRAAGKLA